MVDYFSDEVRKRISDIVEILQRNSLTSSGFSLVRLGDGEGTLLGYPGITQRDDVNYFLNLWFGHSNFSDEELRKIKRKLIYAIKSANIVGVPSFARQKNDIRCGCIKTSLALEGITIPDEKLTWTIVNHFIQYGLYLQIILENHEFCGIISGHWLKQLVRNTFLIPNVVQYKVPPEKAYFSDDTKSLHYPDCYNNLYQTIRVPYRGAPFLVGAGPLGKIYCSWIKERGGTAIDMGSVFDGWINVATRRKITDAPELYSIHEHRNRTFNDTHSRVMYFQTALKKLKIKKINLR